MQEDVRLPFPSEAEALRRQCQAEQGLSAKQRLQAAADILATAQALSKAGGMREADLQCQENAEQEWRRRMKEFIKTHASA